MARRTAREREEAVRASEARLRLLLSRVPAAVWTTDRELRVTALLGAGAADLAIRRGPVAGIPVGDLLGTDEPDYAAVAAHRRALRGETVDAEYARDGRTFHMVVAPFYGADGQPAGAIGLAIDVTERKRAEERVRDERDQAESLLRALSAATAELERSNRDLEQFAYVASHDLQEPLRMVAGYTQLLERRYADLMDDDAQEYLRYAADGALRMQGLIEDLLTYARAGSAVRPLEPVSLNSALDEALDDLAGALEDSGARVRRASPLPMAAGDPGQLRQVFRNLIGNALKFRHADPPEVRISAERCEQEWLVRVADNGIGIEPEHADRVFDLFQRLHTREEYPGTGIGLAICKKIAARHGGRIWTEPNPGGGSIFCFTLPVTLEERLDLVGVPGPTVAHR